MAPSREVLENVQQGKTEYLSAHYTNIIDEVIEYAQSAPSQREATTKGTLFGAYNAVTGYFQNVRKFSSTEQKFKSILTGTASIRAQKVFDLCLNFKN